MVTLVLLLVASTATVAALSIIVRRLRREVAYQKCNSYLQLQVGSIHSLSLCDYPAADSYSCSFLLNGMLHTTNLQISVLGHGVWFCHRKSNVQLQANFKVCRSRPGLNFLNEEILTSSCHFLIVLSPSLSQPLKTQDLKIHHGLTDPK